MNKNIVDEFLRESNGIEGVYDETSFKNAKKAWEFMSKLKEARPSMILELHNILMANTEAWSEPELREKYQGAFRDCPVYIGGREALFPVLILPTIFSWSDKVRASIKDAKKMTDNEKEELSKKLHVEYERIHPFIDGNGRTGRILMNWFNQQIGLPILVIHVGEEQYDYYKWFKDVK